MSLTLITYIKSHLLLYNLVSLLGMIKVNPLKFFFILIVQKTRKVRDRPSSLCATLPGRKKCYYSDRFKKSYYRRKKGKEAVEEEE